MMEEPKGKLYESLDYAKFKYLKGNRTIKENGELRKSIKQSGILVPIEVNENFEIIDGQTRFVIAQALGIPVPYRIAVGLDISDVIDLNSTTKTWNLNDYIHKYVVEGNENYIRLSRIIREYRIVSPSSIITVAMGYCNASTLPLNLTREGQFEFYNYDEFIYLLDSYSDFCGQTGLKTHQYTFSSYLELFITNKFSNLQLINGFKKMNKREVEGVFHKGVVLEFFLRAHNYGLGKNSPKFIEYKLKHNGDPVVVDIVSTSLIMEV